MRGQPPVCSQLDFGHPLAQGIVGCYLFNEGSGGKVYDISGRQNHGMLTSMDPATDWVPGIDGWALDFEGVNDYILLGNPPGLQITSALTIMAQIKVDAYTTSPIIMAKHMGSPNRGYYLQGRATGVLDFGVSSTGANLNTISSTTSIGTGWRHVAGRFAPSTRQSVFVDGVEESPQTVGVYASIYNTPANARIGAHDVPGAYMDGKIEYVYIWNRPLAAAEVAWLFADPYCFVRPVAPARSYFYFGGIITRPYYYREFIMRGAA